MLSSHMELSIVVPALNEEESLRAWLPGVLKAVRELGADFELLVVDGGSQDKTAEVARSHGARIIPQTAPGFGGAVKTGLEAAAGDWILAMDADGSHPPEDIKGLWDARQDADLVIGSRWAGSRETHQPWARRALSVILNGVSRWWLDWEVRDASSGFRLYRASAVKGLPIEHRHFSVQQELLARLLRRGARVREVPFTYSARIGGESKASVLRFALSYVKLLLQLKVLREGRAGVLAPAACALAAALAGFWGLGWGLPGPERLRAFPPGTSSPELARKLADAWSELYDEIAASHKEMRAAEPVTHVVGVEELAPGWKEPPAALLNSYRSFLLRSAHPDERKPFTILARMRPWKLEFEPLYVHYGGAYIYPFGAFLAAGHAVRALTLDSDPAFYIARPEQMARLYLAGRLFILLFHFATLLVLYDLGKRLGGWKAGLAACLLFALSPAAAWHSHISKPHPFGTFWALLAVRAAFSAAESGRRRDYLLSGLWAGVAAGSNLGLAAAAGVPALAWIARRLAGRAQAREWALPLAAGALAGAACLAANPYLLFSYASFRWELEVLLPPGARLDWSKLPGLFTVVLPSGLGCVATALGGVGLLASLRKSDPRRLLLAASALLLLAWFWSRYWFVGMEPSTVRLFYPLAPLLALFAADLLARLPGKATLPALLALCLVEAAPSAAAYLENMRLDSGAASTRARAADWIDANVPAGASVGLTRYPEPAHTPPFRFDRYALVLFESTAALGKKRPDFIVVDAEGAAKVEAGLGAEYAVAASFEPVAVLWGRAVDDSFFANGTARVYARSKP
jgi:dolichol-phosphate mannosyltransferase